MSTFEYFGKIVSFDMENSLISIRVDFITPEMQKELEDALVQDKMRKFKHSSVNTTSISYEQQKLFYYYITQILLKTDIEPTADNKLLLDEEIRKELFPVKYIDYGDRVVPRPKRMKEMNHREMARVLNRLLERYQYLNIEV